MTHLRLLTGIAGLALVAMPLASASAGNTMTITAVVQPTCSVETGTMDFGTLDGDEPAVGAEAALNLECSPGTAYAVTMDEGLHDGRRMADLRGGGFLDYEIFQDAAGTRRWGGTMSSAVSGIAPSAGGKVSLQAYGRLVSRAVSAGRYGDVITVSVLF